jgi:peroxiredoxin
MASHSDVAVLIVLSSEPKSTEKYRLKHSLETPVVSDPKERLFAAGRVRVSPFAVASDATYTVRRKGLVNNQDHLKFLTATQDSHVFDESSVPFASRRTDAIELVR